jgi:hypothetical protein
MAYDRLGMTSDEPEQSEPATRLASGCTTAGVQLGFTRLRNAASYVSSSGASNTERAYRSDWADFTAWCTLRSLQVLPASTATVAA